MVMSELIKSVLQKQADEEQQRHTVTMRTDFI